jgi:hypothetical protein
MRRVQRARLAAEEALGEVVRVPQVEVADLWPLDADDAEDMPGRNVEGTRVARRTMISETLVRSCRAASYKAWS